MSLGSPMNPRICVDSVCFGAAPLEADIKAWLELGVRQIGVLVHKIDQAGWVSGIDSIRNSGLKVATLMHPLMFPVDDKKRWETVRTALIRSIDAAKELDADSVYITS